MRAICTRSRRPTIHPLDVDPISAVAAPDRPEAEAVLHSTTRADPAAVANANATVEAPA